MKNGIIKVWGSSIIIACILFSCRDKTVDYGLGAYYVEIVTAQNRNEFITDKGKMIIADPNENTKTYVNGDRVLINYTVLSETESADSYSVRINGSSKIPLAKLTLTDGKTIHSVAKEPVLLESVWLGSHYLNMLFYFNFKSTSHTIGVLTDSTSIKSDTIRMYFSHDTKNDPPGYPNRTYLSVELKDVLGEPGHSRPVTVQINTNNYGNKTYKFEY